MIDFLRNLFRRRLPNFPDGPLPDEDESYPSFTAVFDYSPFWSLHNTKEQVKIFRGANAENKAIRFCMDWVAKHPAGQARVVPGEVIDPEMIHD